MVEVLRQHLGPDNVLGVGQRLGRIRHDGDQHVFLLAKLSGVEVMLGAEKGELVVGHPFLPGLAKREGEELSNVGFDGNTWLTDTEELR